MTHTPIPWRVGDRKPYIEIWGRMSMNASPILASMECEPREANAAFIVKACNAYDADRALIRQMREALEHVTELLIDTWTTDMDDDPAEVIAVIDARSALAAAQAIEERTDG